MGRTVSAASVLLAALFVATGARAQTDPNDAEYARAAQLRSAQQFDGALAVYQRLVDQTRSPRAIGQMGVTEAQMGRWVAAEEHLAVTLAAHDPWVEHNRPLLQAAFDRAQQNLGSLTVVCAAPGATLRVNGTPAGTFPQTTPVRAPLGPVVIDVAADNYESYRQTVPLSERTTRVEVTLVLRVATAVTSAITPVAAPPSLIGAAALAPPAVTAGTTIPTTRATAGGGPMRTLAWVSAAGAAAFVGLGVVGYVVGSNAATRWNDDSQCLRPGMTRGQVCGSDQSTANSMGALAAVGFVGGGALAVASTMLFIMSRSPRDEATTVRAALTCGPGPGDLGIACGGRF